MIQHLFDLFFPKGCLGCAIPLHINENLICTRCRHALPLTKTHLISQHEISQKFEGRVSLAHVSSLFYFIKDHFTQELIHNLKYRGFQEIGTLLGYWYGNDLKEIAVLQTVNYVIPIPLHPKRFKKRGYNQVETFGKTIAEQLNTTYCDTLLFRKTYSKTQSQKKRNERQEHLHELFGLHEYSTYSHSHFLLVDDVLTTGSTLEAAAQILLQIPNSTVSIVTIAYTRI
jgi:ComF family protein